MFIDDFEIIIASSPDREKVYCEISFKDFIICEISQEEGNLLLEIFPSEGNLLFPLDKFQEVLETSKKLLIPDN